MAYSEDLGKVVGDTYKPSVKTILDEGKMVFTFTSNDNSEDKITFDCKIPIIIPQINTNNNTIDFILGEISEENITNNVVESINMETLRGPTGISTFNIEIIEGTIEDIDKLETNTLYLKIQADGDETDNIDNKVDAYIFNAENGKLEKINSVIDLSDYYTKEEINISNKAIEKSIEDKMDCIARQQQSINDLLNKGLTVSEETSLHEVNISDSERSDVINSIKTDLETYVQNYISNNLDTILNAKLQEYLTEQDINFFEENGVIRVGNVNGESNG